MVITGSNISTQSKVVFLEKGTDGRSQWEMEARLVPEKSAGTTIVVKVPPYMKKPSGPVQVQFYVSNGKRRRSLMQSFTFLPGSHRPHPNSTTTAALPPLVKQETGWDHVSHNAPGFSAQTSPDLSYYTVGQLQNAPRLHHPPPLPPEVPLQATLNYPQSSPVPLQPPLIPPQAPGYTVPPQPFVTPVDAQKENVLQNAGPVLNIKQEPEEQQSLGCLGLQEITLDDVNEIIDRDISGLSSLPSQFDPFQTCEWEHHKPKDALPFCGAPQ